MRGSRAAISVKRKGWKGGRGSSSLSIEVGIDLWQLSIKVCESRTTRWESGFPSPAKDEWPEGREGQGFRTRLPEKNHKNHCISLLYLAVLFITAKSLCWELYARELEDINAGRFYCFGFSISLFGSGLKFVRRCLADFLVTTIAVETSSIRGSQFLRVTFFLVDSEYRMNNNE